MMQAIVIAGMHRSGTSCLARVLSLCGLTLPKTLVVPADGATGDANSRRGFWESEVIRDLNEALLASAGSSWDDYREFPRTWYGSRHRAVFERSALAGLRAEFGEAPRFVVKDPRICRLVPFWLAVFAELGAQPHFVLPVRHPLEVAASLRSRDGIPPAKGRLLWLRHVLAAERDTRGCGRVVLSFRDLLADWRGQVQRVFEAARLELPDLGQGSAVSGQIEAYLDPRLCHHVLSAESEEGEDLPRILQSTWRAVRDAARDGAKITDALEGAADRLDEAEAAFGPLLDLEPAGRGESAKNGRAPAPGTVQPLAGDLDRLDRRLGEIEHWRVRAERELARLSFNVERLEANLATIGAVSRMESARSVNLTGEISELEASGRDLGAGLSLLSDRQTQLAETVRTTETSLESRLDQLGEALAAATAPRRGRAATAARDLLATLLLAAPGWLGRRRLVRRVRASMEAGIIARSGLLDRSYYLRSNRDVAAARLDPLDHFIQVGAEEGRRPNPLFDPAFYVRANPQAHTAGINPLVHFIVRGAGDGCDPCADFDTSFYVSEYPEIAAAGLNPLFHYLRCGAREGRRVKDDRDAERPDPARGRRQGSPGPGSAVAAWERPA
jgi:hypothetical protein